MLAEILSVGICGSDKHMYVGEPPSSIFPSWRVMSWSGRWWPWAMRSPSHPMLWVGVAHICGIQARPGRVSRRPLRGHSSNLESAKAGYRIEYGQLKRSMRDAR